MRRGAALAVAALTISLALEGARAQPLPPELPPIGRTRAEPVLPPEAPIGRTRPDPVLPEEKPARAGDAEAAPESPAAGATADPAGQDAEAAETALDASADGGGSNTAPATPSAGAAAAGLPPIGADTPQPLVGPPVPDVRPASGRDNATEASDADPSDSTAEEELTPIGAEPPVSHDGPPLPDARPADGPAAAPADAAAANAETLGKWADDATDARAAEERNAASPADPSTTEPEPIGETPPVRRAEPPVPVPAPVPDAAPDAAAPARQTGPREQDAAEAAACEAELTRLGVRFERRDPLAEGDCGAARPLAVSAVGDIALSGEPVLRCPAALATARWVREVVAPAAELHLDTTVAAVDAASGYTCRARRTGVATDTLSEHAFANALDVAAVRLADGRRVPVAPRDDASPERAFQAAIRGGACVLFTTVIGPTTNALHDDHLHLDLAERRGASKLCE